MPSRPNSSSRLIAALLIAFAGGSSTSAYAFAGTVNVAALPGVSTAREVHSRADSKKKTPKRARTDDKKRSAKDSVKSDDKPTPAKRGKGAPVKVTATPAPTVEAEAEWKSFKSKSVTRNNYSVANPTGERVLVEVHIGRFASKSILAFEQLDGELLVPVMPILKLAGVSAKIQNERLLGRQSSTGPKFSFDVRSKELRHGDEAWFVPAKDVARNHEGLWVTVKFLKKLMGVEASYDQGSADLEIRDGERFPVGVRTLRDASIVGQRAKLSEAKHVLAPVSSADAEAYSPRKRAVVVDYQFSHNLQPSGFLSSGAAAHSDFEAAFGASFPAMNGVMNVRTTASNSMRSYSSTMWWTMTRPTNSVFSELSIGEVRTRGFQSREVRGFSITNGDPVPDLNAGETQYALRLPSNWQLDAFRGANLISTSLRADGEHVLPVSLSYGTNTIDFIAHGPDGQEREFQRSFHTPSMYVTPHELDYAVAGGLCEETAVCLARMNADLRFGVVSNLVLRAGVDGRLGSIKKDPNIPTTISTNALVPYAGISAVLARATVVDASIQPAVGSSARADGAIQVRYEPNPNFILSSDLTAVSTPLYRTTLIDSPVDSGNAQEQKSIGDWMRTNRVAGYLHYAPSFTKDRASLEAFTSVQSWNTAKASTTRIGFSAQLKGVQMRPYVRFESRRLAATGSPVSNGVADAQAEANDLIHTSYQGIDATYVPSFRSASSFGEWWFRGSLETSRNRFDNWSASLARAFGRMRVDAALLKRSGVPGRSWTLSLVSELPQLQTANFSSSATANSRATSITQVQGSAIYDRELRRMTLSAEPATGRAGVAGVVFLDANADGIKQADEAPIPDVHLYVNNKALVTDQQGSYLVWGLPGYTAQQVLVDTSSFIDPTWIPMQPRSFVKTLAGTLVTANIPVVIGGTLQGSIRTERHMSVADSATRDSVKREFIAGATSPLDSLRQKTTSDVWNHAAQLVLVNASTGLRRLIDTFSDGTFYEEGLAPGAYTIFVDPASLIGTDLSSAPIHTVIKAGRPSLLQNSSALNTARDAELVVWLRPADRKNKD